MAQRGTIQHVGRHWYVLFWEQSTTRRQKKRVRLAPYDKDHPDEASVVLLAAKVLEPYNRNQISPESSMTVRKFVEEIYLPHVRRELRQSTAKDYTDVYRVHLQNLLGDIRMRDFRTMHGQKILRDVKGVGHTSRLRIKSFLSGVFKHARREGVLDTPNPMMDTSAPGKSSKHRMPAYALEQINDMLVLFEYPTKAVIAFAALTGLRLSEIRALKWSDYDGESITVNRTLWRTHFGEPKTPASEARVPVLPQLQQVLSVHRLDAENNHAPDDAHIFVGAKGKPLNLANLARRVIIPKLEEEKIPWLGWHAFRRGLATNLNSLGVPLKTIQGILRHSDIRMTADIYVQPLQQDAVDALRKLEESLVRGFVGF